MQDSLSQDTAGQQRARPAAQGSARGSHYAGGLAAEPQRRAAAVGRQLRLGRTVDHLVNIAQVGVLQLPAAPVVSAAERQEQRNREFMLNRVQRVWIDGVLAHSLAGPARLPVGLAYQPGAVPDRWSQVAHQAAPAPESAARRLRRW